MWSARTVLAEYKQALELERRLRVEAEDQVVRLRAELEAAQASPRPL